MTSREKTAIVAAFQRPANETDLRRADAKAVISFSAVQLADFATQRSLNFFSAPSIGRDFLHSDPETWHSREDYRNAKTTVSALGVINDCAERSVKLTTDLNVALTHDEKQRQLIF